MSNNKNNRKTGIPRLLEVSSKKKKLLIAAIASGIMGTAARLLPFLGVYFIVLEIIGNWKNPGAVNSGHITIISLWLLLAPLVLAAVLIYVGNMCSHIAAYNILYNLRMSLSEKLAVLPMGFFNKRNSGTVKKIVVEDVENIEQFVAHHIVDFVSGVAAPLIIVVIMFAVDWRLALATVLTIPAALAAAVSIYAGKQSRSLRSGYVDAAERMNGSIVEYVRGMSVIKIFNQVKLEFKKLSDDIRNVQSKAKEWCDHAAFRQTLFQTLISATALFLVPTGVFMLLNGTNYTEFLPELLFFFIVGANFSGPMIKLILLTGRLGETNAAMERIDGILNEHEITDSGNPCQCADASLELRSVSFSYEDAEILKNVSFKCEQGTLTALVGPSGAGKSTIAQLIARFWDVDKGSIQIGGTDIRALSSQKLYDTVSFVFQDVAMQYDTIENNIRMGNTDVPFEDVERAARAAQIHHHIMTLQDGYQTLIGEGGVYLSGGEQQRISIARVILKDTPIIVLDEATAYADAENESLIQRAFSRLCAGKTVIVIAHRLSTIVNAENIILVADGTVAAQGTHLSLLEQSGLYRSMWQSYQSAQAWELGKKGGYNAEISLCGE